MSFIIRLGLILILLSQVYPCRMLGVIALPGESLSTRNESDSLHHYLVAELEELRLQGGSGSWPYNNRDGWAMVSYPVIDSDITIQAVRSELEAYEDESYYEQTDQLLDYDNVPILMGHLRQSTSGADDIPNPHPFIYEDSAGVKYSFSHNGDMDKDMLRSLIGDDWLTEHPPQTYGGGPWDGGGWDEVVDSELFLFFIVKNIEETGSVVNGIKHAMQELETEMSFDIKNFLMSDGVNLYAYRSSPMDDIYYFDGSDEPETPWYLEQSNHRAVMSTPPPVSPMSEIPWIELEDLYMVILKADGTSDVIDVMSPEDIIVFQHQLPDSKLQMAFPNPFNSSTIIPIKTDLTSDLVLRIFDMQGVQVYSAHKYAVKPGQTRFEWMGNDENGNVLESGSYFYQINGSDLTVTGKLLLLK